MALIDRFKERITTALLTALTNPDDATGVGSNDTWLQRVCDDVEAEFPSAMNEDYDETVRVHILAAVALIRLKLIEYGAAPDESGDKLSERLTKQIEKYRMVRARDRISPQTSSELTPSEEVSDVEIVRPGFDDVYFEDMTPEADPPQTDE